jgi:DNA-binding MarR family transcriptional regulator
MDNTISREFFSLMGLINKILKSYHPMIKLHHGEFMMLGAIHGCSKEAYEKDNKSIGISVSELSEKTHATRPAVSKMLTSLEDKGYIKRTISLTDRRVVYITLTDNGQSIIDEALNTMYQLMDNAMHSLGEEDSKELIVLMKRLCDALSEQSAKGNVEEEKSDQL